MNGSIEQTSNNRLDTDPQGHLPARVPGHTMRPSVCLSVCRKCT